MSNDRGPNCKGYPKSLLVRKDHYGSTLIPPPPILQPNRDAQIKKNAQKAFSTLINNSGMTRCMCFLAMTRACPVKHMYMSPTWFGKFAEQSFFLSVFTVDLFRWAKSKIWLSKTLHCSVVSDNWAFDATKPVFGFPTKWGSTRLLSYSDWLENWNFACSKFRYDTL